MGWFGDDKEIDGNSNLIVENEIKITDNDSHYMLGMLLVVESIVLILMIVKLIIKKARKSQAIESHMMRNV